MTEFYLYDPEKNTECSKTSCHDLCWMTTHKEFSRDNIPLTDDQRKIYESAHQVIIDSNTHEWRLMLEDKE